MALQDRIGKLEDNIATLRQQNAILTTQITKFEDYQRDLTSRLKDLQKSVQKTDTPEGNTKSPGTDSSASKPGVLILFLFDSVVFALLCLIVFLALRVTAIAADIRSRVPSDGKPGEILSRLQSAVETLTYRLPLVDATTLNLHGLSSPDLTDAISPFVERLATAQLARIDEELKRICSDLPPARSQQAAAEPLLRTIKDRLSAIDTSIQANSATLGQLTGFISHISSMSRDIQEISSAVLKFDRLEQDVSDLRSDVRGLPKKFVEAIPATVPPPPQNNEMWGHETSRDTELGRSASQPAATKYRLEQPHWLKMYNELIESRSSENFNRFKAQFGALWMKGQIANDQDPDANTAEVFLFCPVEQVSTSNIDCHGYVVPALHVFSHMAALTVPQRRNDLLGKFFEVTDARRNAVPRAAVGVRSPQGTVTTLEKGLLELATL